ncbi:MAG: 4Fe-4S binding protein [Deltaproteobacteria bacterium]|nr:4Fe-4S binding protein [Deltaproteobacteria bacterium]
MLESIALLLFLGLAAGIGLGIASRIFYVWEDPKVLAILDCLPGANCGGCGQAGCGAAAEAMAAGRIECNVCVVGGFETAKAVGAILGQEVKEREPDFALSSCIYGVGEADPIFTYNGATDCRAAVMLYGGSKLCTIGCVGMGTCVKVCPFNALSMGEDNLPVVNHDRCVGCGTCVEACPKNIITLSSATRRITSEYVTDECTAPCQRACPTGIDVRGYIREIKKGNYEDALRIIKEKCPLPLVCGYICPAPCELACRRNLADKAVAIDPLKRFVADYERTTGKQIQPYKTPSNGIKIAVIGGGTEGMTTAYYLARLGYEPTIFESKPQLGGILRHAISEDRLPRDVLDHDIKGVLDMGVEAKTGQVMGRDFTVDGLLKEGYDAVVLTTGGFDSRQILNPAFSQQGNVPVAGVFTMLDFLMALSRGQGVSSVKHAVMCFSGEKTLETARKLRGSGCDKVTIVADKPSAALPNELRGIHANPVEGIEVRPSNSIVAMGGISDHLCRIMIQEVNEKGDICGAQEILDADLVIIPGARFPEWVFVHANGKPETPSDELKWQTIDSFQTFPRDARKGIIGAPEPGRMSDSTAVVKAILSGRRLARAVNQYFSNGVILPIEHLALEAESIPDVTELHHITTSERVLPALAYAEDKTEGGAMQLREPLPAIEESDAVKEAERCLQCGLICYKKG